MYWLPGGLPSKAQSDCFDDLPFMVTGTLSISCGSESAEPGAADHKRKAMQLYEVMVTKVARAEKVR